MQRLNHLNGQFDSQQTINAGSVTAKSANDVVIVSYARTAVTRGKKGPQANTGAEAMLLPVLQDVLKKANNIDPKLIEEVCVGNVLQPGAGAITSRIAQLLAGIPDCCPNHTINRQCSSGLQAVATIANAIVAGQIEIGIGGGVESMSNGNMMGQVNAELLSDKVFDHEQAQKCLIPMGITSENVAAKYGITRE
jgi:acetyl-CoA acyltransferase 1